MLHDMVFPKADRAGLHTTNRTQFDVALANKKLLFAANWSIEQATINNLKVYVLWLRWLSDQLQGYCSFFSSFLKLLNEEMNHSRWNCIKQSHEVLRKDLILQPMLSLDHANLTGNQHLINKCVGLLRLSHQQWHAETEFKYSVCMSAFIMSNVDEGNLDVLKQMEEMYQVVFRFDTGKYKKLRSECDEFLKLVATPFDLLRKLANLTLQQQADVSDITSLLVVFRSDTGKYKKLRSECDEFLKLVATPFDLLRKLANLTLQQQADVSDITSLLILWLISVVLGYELEVYVIIFTML
ncbi:ATPase [Artemisia annua]|uniref:ATPase n=1 Tax=Artemisia annua TaxID=35608 RepID=A0A2U1KE59_ARTAN|nr:ATPase [Artemisia annua]